MKRGTFETITGVTSMGFIGLMLLSEPANAMSMNLIINDALTAKAFAVVLLGLYLAIKLVPRSNSEI